jgi:hypothetical protein
LKRICKHCNIEKELQFFQNAKNCNLGKRHTCKNCGKINKAKYYLDNLEYFSEKNNSNKKEKVIYNKNWIESNPEYHSQWREQNKEKIQNRNSQYSKDNKHTINAKTRAYQLKKDNRLLGDQKVEIEKFYEEARRLTELTAIQFEVDHIVPITNDSVSGLHCVANLQVMPYYQNRIKHNYFVG